MLLEACTLTLIILTYFTLYVKHKIPEVLCTNASYYQWDEYRKALVLNINYSCDLILIATGLVRTQT